MISNARVHRTCQVRYIWLALEMICLQICGNDVKMIDKLRKTPKFSLLFRFQFSSKDQLANNRVQKYYPLVAELMSNSSCRIKCRMPLATTQEAFASWDEASQKSGGVAGGG